VLTVKGAGQFWLNNETRGNYYSTYFERGTEGVRNDKTLLRNVGAVSGAGNWRGTDSQKVNVPFAKNSECHEYKRKGGRGISFK